MYNVLYLSVPSRALTFIAYVCCLHIFKCYVVCKFNMIWYDMVIKGCNFCPTVPFKSLGTVVSYSPSICCRPTLVQLISLFVRLLVTELYLFIHFFYFLGIDFSVYVLFLSVPSHALTFIAYVCCLHIFKCCVVCKFNMIWYDIVTMAISCIVWEI